MRRRLFSPFFHRSRSGAARKHRPVSVGCALRTLQNPVLIFTQGNLVEDTGFAAAFSIARLWDSPPFLASIFGFPRSAREPVFPIPRSARQRLAALVWRRERANSAERQTPEPDRPWEFGGPRRRLDQSVERRRDSWARRSRLTVPGTPSRLGTRSHAGCSGSSCFALLRYIFS